MHNFTIAFLPDYSVISGSGHLQRCLALAHGFNLASCKVSFFLEKKMLQSEHVSILQNKFPYISFCEKEFFFKNPHIKYNLTFIDDYNHDYKFEEKVKPFTHKIFVIDDLANRVHDCDYLLDQNFILNFENRYDKITSDKCVKFLGPKYCLLRNEFTHKANLIKLRKPELKRILITFGGSDLTHETLKTIHAIQCLNHEFDKVDIVIGQNFTDKNDIILQANNIKNSEIHIQSQIMSELMLNSDLCIGAGGTTSWERCYMALPSCVIDIADNQTELIEALKQKEALYFIGKSKNVTSSDIKDVLNSVLSNPSIISLMSKKAHDVLSPKNHLGVEYLVKSIINDFRGEVNRTYE